MFGKKDPVCGVKVDKKNSISLIYEGKVYYFDCLACKATFLEKPVSFIKKKNVGFLKKIALKKGEASPSCHACSSKDSCSISE